MRSETLENDEKRQGQVETAEKPWSPSVSVADSTISFLLKALSFLETEKPECLMDEGDLPAGWWGVWVEGDLIFWPQWLCRV